MKIFIAVPTFENIYPDTFKSIYDLENPHGHEYVFEFVRGYDIATARNRIVFRAKDLKADYILMVDNDVTLPPDALTKLLEHDKEVVLGFYAHRNNQNEYDGKTNLCKLGEFNYTNQFTEDDLRAIREEGETLIQIHGGGMGCACIKTSLFDVIHYPYYDWVNYDDEHRGMLSEDLYFCEQCKWVNVPVYADPRVGCGHLFRKIQTCM